MSAGAVRTLGVALILLTHAAFANAQPGPEHKKLDAMAGKWRIDTDVKASSAAAASKASGTEDCQWFANLHLVCRSEATGAGGLYSSMRTISYIPSLKQVRVILHRQPRICAAAVRAGQRRCLDPCKRAGRGEAPHGDQGLKRRLHVQVRVCGSRRQVGHDDGNEGDPDEVTRRDPAGRAC